MKNTRTNKLCLDCAKKLTSANSTESRLAGNPEICDNCWDYAGHENTHSDYAHDTLAADDPELIGCRVCEKDMPTGEEESGHTNTAARTYSSHANCKHLRTPKERAACRKNRKAGHASEEMIEAAIQAGEKARTERSVFIGKGLAVHLERKGKVLCKNAPVASASVAQSQPTCKTCLKRA